MLLDSETARPITAKGLYGCCIRVLYRNTSAGSTYGAAAERMDVTLGREPFRVLDAKRGRKRANGARLRGTAPFLNLGIVLGARIVESPLAADG